MKKNGFTMMEVTIAVSIMTMIGFMLFSIQKDIFTFNRFVQGSLSREGDVRKFLKEFALEVRGASQSSTGSYVIEQAATSSFIFYSDIDGNGVKERLRYFLSGTSLRKGVMTATGTPLAYNLGTEEVRSVVSELVATTTPIFYYYDVSYTGSSSPLIQPVPVASVRLVRAVFTVDPSGGKSPVPSTFSVQAAIRALRNQ